MKKLKGFWKCLLCAGSLATCAAISISPAYAADEELAELKARLERLEQQNEYLRRVIESGVRPATGVVEREQIEQIVQDLIQVQASKEVKKEPSKEEWLEVGKDLNLRARWRDGLYFDTADGAFSVRVRGRVDNDWGWVTADPQVTEAPGGIGTLDDGVIFRRARLGVQGTIYEVFYYTAEYDFGEGVNTRFADVFMGVNQLPYIGSFQAGHYKEPFSLEQLTSARFITFIERSILDDAFVPARNTGMSIQNAVLDERVTYAVGLFRPTNDVGGVVTGAGDGEYALTARVTALPWYEHDGRCLLHLGIAGSHRDLDDGQIRFRTRPYRMPTVRNFLDTGTVFGENEDLLGLEAALVLGPLSIQSEYMHAWVDSAVVNQVPLGEIGFDGFYIYVSYFLTGENRVYRKPEGVFDRVRPFENFWLVRTGEEGCLGHCLGLGAWEITARYAHLNLRDTGIDRGQLNQWTIGLTWYWNPNMKVLWNYEILDVNRPGSANDGEVQSLVMRFHLDF